MSCCGNEDEVLVVGDVAVLRAKFINPKTCQPIDPTTVEIKIRDPAGNESSFVFGVDPEVVRDGVGLYHFNLTIGNVTSAVSRYWFRWIAGGIAQGAAEGFVDFQPTQFATP